MLGCGGEIWSLRRCRSAAPSKHLDMGQGGHCVQRLALPPAPRRNSVNVTGGARTMAARIIGEQRRLGDSILVTYVRYATLTVSLPG